MSEAADWRAFLDPPGGDCLCKCHATGDQDVW